MSSPIGCSAMRGGGTGLQVRRRAHLQRDPLVPHVLAPAGPSVTRPSSCTVMSSTMRTPWPSRSAPHHCSASQIDGSPNASPAWMVKCAFSRRRYSKASRCRVGGKPASAPAMSKPTTPPSRNAHDELGDLPRAGRVPHRGEQGAHDRIGVPGGRGPALALLEPVQHRLARPRPGTARRSGAARGRTGPRRRRRRRRPGPRRTPRATRCSASRVCITPTVCVEGLQVALQRAGVGRPRRTSGPARRGRSVGSRS